MKTYDARTIDRWRAWLEKHHASETEIWLIFHKQHTGTPSVDYMDALDEALCYGWIDSLIKRIDDDRYARKFTPRKADSKWSDINRKRYATLAKAGRLAPAGKADVLRLDPSRQAAGDSSTPVGRSHQAALQEAEARIEVRIALIGSFDGVTVVVRWMRMIVLPSKICPHA